MDFLRQKSDFNFNAAQILIDKDLFAPCVHCTYYSCFQLLKHLVKNYIGIEYDVQESEIRIGTQGSHNYVIKKILDEIYRNSRLDYSDINRKIKQLKSIREQSDYQNIQITHPESKKAIEYAQEVRSYLFAKMS